MENLALSKINEIIGKNISRILKEKELTCEWLSKQMNTSNTVTFKWLNGESRVHADNLVKMSFVLNTDIQEFLTEEVK